MFIALPLFSGCGADGSEQQSTNASATENSLSAESGATPDNLPPAALTPIENPVSEGIIRILTDGIWQYEGVLNMKAEQTMQKGEGRWVQFKADGTFSYGVYDETSRTGRWQFLESDYVIEMIYNDTPSELLGFRCQFGGEEALVLVGDARYKTNSIQMKWNKQPTFPTKE